ncbi:ABC-type Mn2 /Zn2 transport system, permease component [Cenarchaeum symbiosum A]|uniref:ABC-type Mn2 /Zn2 transport system, permease component n=1 Tax=Cenarchaeum symbiosum (strain A) TaxID=414004 RepID=A0RWG7_CENSY|nr:ABC-type Mn2 /Zn2 transport system, permease component [Cenarchaeum symbiosum A]
MVLEALAYGFMQKALIAGAAVAVTCSLVGMFLVLRRYSLFGDGISHVAFGGVAAGLFLGVFPLWGAYAASILGGLSLQRLRSSSIPGDAAVAVVLVSGLAAGVILVSASGGFSADLFSFLFGSILLVSIEDVVVTVAASAGVAGAILALRGQLLHISFSEEQARISGINVTLLNYLFVALAAVAVVTSMRLVGILLISALVVVPSVTAMLFGRGFGITLVISASVSVFSVVLGILLSYYASLAPSGTIVAVAVVFLAGVIGARSAGLLPGGRSGLRS